MERGPIDETVEKASAGVGALWNPNTMNVHVANLNTDKANDIEHIGRSGTNQSQSATSTRGQMRHQEDKQQPKTNELTRDIDHDARIRNQPYFVAG